MVKGVYSVVSLKLPNEYNNIVCPANLTGHVISRDLVNKDSLHG